MGDGDDLIRKASASAAVRAPSSFIGRIDLLSSGAIATWPLTELRAFCRFFSF